MTRTTIFLVSIFCSATMAIAQDDILKTLQEEGPSQGVYIELDSLQTMLQDTEKELKTILRLFLFYNTIFLEKVF